MLEKNEITIITNREHNSGVHSEPGKSSGLYLYTSFCSLKSVSVSGALYIVNRNEKFNVLA